MAGKRWKSYYNTGTHSIPVWAAMTRVQNITAPRTKGETDGSRQESGDEISQSTLKKYGLELTYVYKKGDDAVYDALLDSFENDTPIQFAVCDGDISTPGTRRLMFWGEVMEFPIETERNGGDVFPVKIANVAEDEDGDYHAAEHDVIPQGT